MVGLKFADKEKLKLTFVVINDLGEDNFLVLNYKNIVTNYGQSFQILEDSNIISKQTIVRDYVEFDSPEFHKIMKIIEKSILG